MSIERGGWWKARDSSQLRGREDPQRKRERWKIEGERKTKSGCRLSWKLETRGAGELSAVSLSLSDLWDLEALPSPDPEPRLPKARQTWRSWNPLPALCIILVEEIPQGELTEESVLIFECLLSVKKISSLLKTITCSVEDVTVLSSKISRYGKSYFLCHNRPLAEN